MQEEGSFLPSLAYVGDVPVESSYHGSALLYRLLQNYPPDRLRVVETTLLCSKPERRLPGAVYRTVRIGNPRLLLTRFNSWYVVWLSLAAAGRAKRLRPHLEGFEPEAVLTVAHGCSWLTAAAYARKHGLPLYLVIHDDWPRVTGIAGSFQHWLDRAFGRVYRQAVARFCVSPFMVEDYRARYGADGEVLYPSRAAHASPPANPSGPSPGPNSSLRVAFAGTLTTPDYWRSLRSLARCLQPMNGEILIYSPMSGAQAAGAGLDLPNIQLRGFVKPEELIGTLRAEADVLFVPMSFADADRANMRMGFPSKLTDCTATGLPLLIHGPPYCSAVRWANENPGVAEVVTAREDAALNEALRRLSNPGHRATLGATAVEVGQKYFSHDRAETLLFERLREHARDQS